MEFTRPEIMLNKINQLHGYTIMQEHEIKVWQTWEGSYTGEHQYENIGEKKYISVGDRWVASDGYTRWFATELTVPPEMAGQAVYLNLEFGGEGLVWVNGRRASAITSYLVPRKSTRTRVKLCDAAQAGEHYEVEVEACMQFMEFSHMRPKGHTSVEYQIRTASFHTVDKVLQDYYFDVITVYEALEVIKNPFDTVRKSDIKLPNELQRFMELVSKDNYPYERLLDLLLRSLVAVDIDFDLDRVRSTIPEAVAILHQGLIAMHSENNGEIILTGHSHIDTAWHWPVKETIRKCARTFSNTLALMNSYDKHIFAHSQPQQYEYMKKYYPDIFAEIKQRVAEGRWELIGNPWVEMDTNVPSGEAIVRQVLYGRQFYLDNFGKCSDVFWMPDVFGYSWAIPQIMKKSGIKYFYTSKLVGNVTNRFPHSLFMWKGMDGTQVPVYLQRVGYNGDPTPEQVHRLWYEYDQKSIYNKALLTFGYGDGGAGPIYEQLEYIERLENLPGLPSCRIAPMSEFFDGIDAVTDELPVWHDEMYYEFHRGTYTSQSRTKMHNRQSELLYRQVEMVSVMAMLLTGFDYPLAELTEQWKQILLYQFHDILPGSSINEVYHDAEKVYAGVLGYGCKVQDNALAAVSNAIKVEQDSVVVYNFLSFIRNDIVQFNYHGNTDKLALLDTDGTAMPMAVCGNTVTFVARAMPSMGYKSYTISQQPVTAGVTVKATTKQMENGFFVVSFDSNMNISSIYDKRSEREVLAEGTVGNHITIFEDRPARESGWNIDLEYKNKYWYMDEATTAEVVEQSDIRGVVRVTRSFNKSVMKQDIILYNDLERIDFVTWVDWQETEKMMKAAFPVDILATHARYEIAYGNIQRPTHENTSWDRQKFEVPAHKWADISEGGYGVSLLNDSKYGYDIHGNVMHITLLRSPIYPDPVADKGEQRFVYSLYPHKGSYIDANTVKQGYMLNVKAPCMVLHANKDGRLPAECSLLSVDSDNVQVEAIKLAEDRSCYIVRVYECNGTSSKVCFHCGFTPVRVEKCNLMEETEQVLEHCVDNFYDSIKPFEINTYRLYL